MNDNERFKQCIANYLHPPDNHPARISNIDEILTYELDFKDNKNSSQN